MSVKHKKVTYEYRDNCYEVKYICSELGMFKPFDKDRTCAAEFSMNDIGTYLSENLEFKEKMYADRILILYNHIKDYIVIFFEYTNDKDLLRAKKKITDIERILYECWEDPELICEWTKEYLQEIIKNLGGNP